MKGAKCEMWAMLFHCLHLFAAIFPSSHCFAQFNFGVLSSKPEKVEDEHEHEREKYEQPHQQHEEARKKE